MARFNVELWSLLTDVVTYIVIIIRDVLTFLVNPEFSHGKLVIDIDITRHESRYQIYKGNLFPPLLEKQASPGSKNFHYLTRI